MKRIMYKDCNNNAIFLKDLFMQIQSFSNAELSWNISNLDLIPIDKGDYVNGIPDFEMEKLFDFQKRVLDEHIVSIPHNVFMNLFENIRTIYEGKFSTAIEDKQIKMTVFDGDIIEIYGAVEDKIMA